jgi:hypothetical protein
MANPVATNTTVPAAHSTLSRRFAASAANAISAANASARISSGGTTAMAVTSSGHR